MRLVTRMHVSSIATVGDRASGYRTSMASENSLIVSAVMHTRSSGVGPARTHARTAISILERRSLSDRRHSPVGNIDTMSDVTHIATRDLTGNRAGWSRRVQGSPWSPWRWSTTRAGLTYVAGGP